MKPKKTKKQFSVQIVTYSNKFKMFKWGHSNFYVKKVNEVYRQNISKQINFKHFYGSRQELFSLRKLINNFCFDGRYLKYFIIFKRAISKIYFHFYSKATREKLTLERWNNLLFFLKNVNTNLLLVLVNHFIYFLFTKNEILFFAKAVKLRKRVAKKLKKKYRLAFEYVPKHKRLFKTIKFWKYYIKSTTTVFLEKRILNGLFRLVVDPKTSILTRYRHKVIKKLIKKKKLNL